MRPVKHAQWSGSTPTPSRRAPRRDPRARGVGVAGFIDPEDLADADVDFDLDPGRARAFISEAADDDAGAPDACDMRAPRPPLPLVRAGPFETYAARVSDPLARASLFRRLLSMLTTSPPASLQRLLEYHDAHPESHSTRALNLLIALAIRHAAFGTARRLLDRFEALGMRGNDETMKLRVRLLVREDRWPDAWALVMGKEDVSNGAGRHALEKVSVAVWAELLGTPKRGARRERRREGGLKMRPVKRVDGGLRDVERYELVMGQIPKLRRTGRPPARVISMAVEALLRMGKREAALEVMTEWLGREKAETGLRLVHLYLALRGSKRGVQSFYEVLRELNGLLSVFGQVRPNGRTLFLVLGHLRRAIQCGTLAERVARGFQRRWGSRVVSGRVRRRVVALAAKEGRQDIVKRWAAGGEMAQRAGRQWKQQGEVAGTGTGTGRRRVARPRLGLVYGKRGTETIREARALRRMAVGRGAGRACAGWSAHPHRRRGG